MATIIDKSNVETHNIDKYNFKVLPTNHKPLSQTLQESHEQEVDATQTQSETKSVIMEEDIDSSALSQSSKDSLIESLLKKTDEMSSNFIKLQMKLEAKEEEFEQTLKEAKQNAYNEGLEAGKEQLTKELQNGYKDTQEQFSKSIATLQESAKKFEVALQNIKSELVGAALDIAKEVVAVEVSQNSQKIAQTLADELIKDLQGASKVTLKVNPKDHGEISQSLGSLENIEIVSDGAVSEGGVIAISDVGNIDAEISKRFQRVKRAALGE